eukprot:3536776-Pyramimonas_sp.AAC.5
MASTAAPEVVFELPEELLHRVAILSCTTFRDWARTWRGVAPMFRRENIRLTQNLLVVGLGHRNEVVVDTVGWEPALV